MNNNRGFDTLVAYLVGNCRNIDLSLRNRECARVTLLEDLRDGIIQTKEQLVARRAKLLPYLGYEKVEYCDEFLDAIWEAYMEAAK